MACRQALHNGRPLTAHVTLSGENHITARGEDRRRNNSGREIANNHNHHDHPEPHTESHTPRADMDIPARHIALHASVMPVHTDMLRVYAPSHHKARPLAWAMAWYKEAHEMPSMGRLRLRPCPLT